MSIPLERQLPRRQILVVEDDSAIAEMLTSLLDFEGYAVSSVGSAEDALALLAPAGACGDSQPSATDEPSKHQPDLILLDLQLPNLMGVDLIQHLTSKAASVPPVIVVSAKRPEAVEFDASIIGAADMILKPFDIDDLLTRIKRALA